MNIQNYLSNPMGKGSSIYMVKEARNSLDNQYLNVKSRIALVWYNLNDEYYIAHIRIPSKSVDSLFYDVLLEFDIKSIPDGASVINDANVRVFSNCPSFTYTYANVFEKNGDLINWTKLKYSSEIFSKDPVQRNPNKLYGYEKSLYLAMKYILSDRRNYLPSIKTLAIKINTYQKIYIHINSASQTEDIYKNNKKKMKEKEDAKKSSSTTTKKTNPKPKTGPGYVKTTKKVKTTKTTATTKKSKITKKI